MYNGIEVMLFEHFVKGTRSNDIRDDGKREPVIVEPIAEIWDFGF